MRFKSIVGFILVLAVILSAGCIAEKTAEVGDTVSVYYTLTLDDGTVKESNVGKTPLTFTIGSGQMISGFNDAVIGMKVGDTKTVRLEPADAYGEITDSMIQEMSLSEVETLVGHSIAVGDILPVSVNTGSSTMQMYAKIMEINKATDTVSAAFIQTPLVGEYLTFEITLASIA